MALAYSLHYDIMYNCDIELSVDLYTVKWCYVDYCAAMQAKIKKILDLMILT